MRTIRTPYHPRGAALALALIASLAACGERDEPVVSPPAPVDQIAVPAGSLHVNDGGGSGGIPVVFVHGYGGDTEQWMAQLDHLRPSRRAVALDLRGHGRSSAPAGNEYSVDAFASDIATVVDSLKLDRFVLVGHSMGGSAAIAYAAAHPDRVAGLVMVGAPGRTPPEQGQQMMAQIEANYDSVTAWYWNRLLTDAQPAVRERVMAKMRSVPKEASLIIISALSAYDPVPALARYPGPKLAIVTAHENGPNDLQNIVRGLPTRTIEQASHWMHMDKPEEFNRVLDAFLSTLQ